RRLADVRVEARGQAEVLLGLLGRKGVPVRDGPCGRALRELRRRVETREVDRRIVGVVAVDEDDSSEARLHEREHEVLDDREVGGYVQVGEPGEPTMTRRQAVR